MTIWHMRIACWIPKAKRTHSEYVILLFHSKNGCTNAPRRHVIRTLPVLLYPISVTHAHILLFYYVSMTHIFASLQSSGRCITPHSCVFIFLSFIHYYCRFCFNVNFWAQQLVAITHNSTFQLHVRKWHGFPSPWIIFLSTLSQVFQRFFTHEYVTFLSQSRAFAPFLFNSTTSFA
jgi:hypothetical protein